MSQTDQAPGAELNGLRPKPLRSRLTLGFAAGVTGLAALMIALWMPGVPAPTEGNGTGSSAAAVTPGKSEGSPNVEQHLLPGPASASGGEAGFLSRVHDPANGGPSAPAAGATVVSDGNVVGIGRQSCAALRTGASRAEAEIALLRTGSFDQRSADTLLAAATDGLCPELRVAPASRIPRDGIFKVDVDVRPGRYVASSKPGCSWTVSTSPDAKLRDVVDSGSSAAMTLVSGQYVAVSQCGVWTRR